METSARCATCGIEAGKPTRPSTHDTTTMPINGQSSKGVTNRWLQWNRLAIHVNPCPLLDETEE
jgi:hypothetical protein